MGTPWGRAGETTVSTYADYRRSGRAWAIIDGKLILADRAALEVLATNAMRLACGDAPDTRTSEEPCR